MPSPEGDSPPPSSPAPAYSPSEEPDSSTAVTVPPGEEGQGEAFSIQSTSAAVLAGLQRSLKVSCMSICPH